MSERGPAKARATSAEAIGCWVLAPSPPIYGEGLTAVATGENIVELELHTVDDDETSELECKPSQYAKLAAVSPSVPPMMELYDEFVAQIETGKSALPTFADGLRNQRVLAAIGYGE